MNHRPPLNCTQPSETDIKVVCADTASGRVSLFSQRSKDAPASSVKICPWQETLKRRVREKRPEEPKTPPSTAYLNSSQNGERTVFPEIAEEVRLLFYILIYRLLPRQPNNGLMDGLMDGLKRMGSSAIGRKNKKTRTGDRKMHVCYFCAKHFRRIDRHILRKHKQERVVQIITSLKDDEEKKKRFKLITRSGDYQHNCEVIAAKSGQLMLVYGAVVLDEGNHGKYLPCPFCFGFMLARNLWQHRNVCVAKEEIDWGTNNAVPSILVESRAMLLLRTDPSVDQAFAKAILCRLATDEIGDLACTDAVMLHYGKSRFNALGEPGSDSIRQEMRVMARLVMHMRGMLGVKVALIDLIINPSHLNDLLNGIKQLCEWKVERGKKPTFEKPNLAVRIAYCLSKFSISYALQLSNALNVEDEVTLRRFVTSWQMVTKTQISPVALTCIRRNPNRQVEVLPLTRDLVEVNKKTISIIREAIQKIRDNDTSRALWSQLCRAVLARVIIFNARRAGEAPRLTLDNWDAKMCFDDAINTCKEITNSLSEVELEMGSQLQLIRIVGKKGNVVPVLLTKEVVEGMEALLEIRHHESVDIHPDNFYFFAATSGSLLNMRGWDAVRSMVSSTDGLAKPENLRSTLFRKYVATVGHLLNLDCTEYGWFNRHFGHGENVHQFFYNLHSDAVEMAKAGTVLTALDGGNIAAMIKSGVKKLTEITKGGT